MKHSRHIPSSDECGDCHITVSVVDRPIRTLRNLVAVHELSQRRHGRGKDRATTFRARMSVSSATETSPGAPPASTTPASAMTA